MTLKNLKSAWPLWLAIAVIFAAIVVANNQLSDETRAALSEPTCELRYDPALGAAEATRGGCTAVVIAMPATADCWRVLRPQQPAELFVWQWWGVDGEVFAVADILPGDQEGPYLAWGLFGPVIQNADGTYSCR